MFNALKKGLQTISQKLGLSKAPDKNNPTQLSIEEQKQEQKISSETLENHLKVLPRDTTVSQSNSEELKKDILECNDNAQKSIFPEKPREKEAKVSFFTKLKSAFSERYFLNGKEIDDLLDTLEISMLQSDVSLQVCELLKKALRNKLKKEGVAKNNQEEYLKELFLSIIFDNYPKPLDESFINQQKKPYVVLFVGTNGSGKTTTIAKFAYFLKSKGKSCVFAASDTYRAAAIDQLEGHANKLHVPIIKGKYGQDPASVAYDAVSFAKNKNIEFVLIDSSGRQDTATNLMKELTKIKNVVKPDFVVFVAEAIAGQTALLQAESFNRYVQFDAFVLTKVDVDDKGGTLLSISLGLQKPVLFLGIGQEYKDIAFFDKEFLENVI